MQALVEGAAVPWCDSCDVYLAPNTVSVEGSCPTCDSEVDASDAKTPPTAKVPWHFWLIVAALVLYLGWRLIIAFGWLLDKL